MTHNIEGNGREEHADNTDVEISRQGFKNKYSKYIEECMEKINIKSKEMGISREVWKF